MALFDHLTRRAEAKAKEAVEATRRNVGAAFATVPDVLLAVEGDRLTITGPGLARRRLNDARMRFAIWTES